MITLVCKTPSGWRKPCRPALGLLIALQLHAARERLVPESIAMLPLIGASALAGLLAAAPASSQTVFVPDRQLLVGRYNFEEEGIAVDVSLNAGSTAVYSVGGSVGIRAEGAWDVRGDRVHIFNKPGPVKLELVGTPTRDPGVALRAVA